MPRRIVLVALSVVIAGASGSFNLWAPRRASAVTASGGVLSSVTPQRILDTRTTLGGHHAALGAGQTMTLPVVGAGGIPPAGVSAVLVNVTAINAGDAGYLTLYKTGTTRPSISALNYPKAQPTANETLVPVGADGTISIYNYSNTSADVLIDAEGWVSDRGAGNGTVNAAQPTRVLDTRTTTGGHNAPLTGGQVISVPVEGVGGVPSSGVAAVAVHVTGVSPTTGTYIRTFASGYTENSITTNSSLLNQATNTVASNSVVVPVGANGSISLYNYAGNVNVVVDVQGWIAAPVLSVTPPVASAFSGGALTSSDGVRATNILQNANQYAMTTWWNSVAPGLLAMPMTNASETSNAAVRRLSAEAYSLATSIATGTYNPTATGVPTATATADAIQLITAVANGHMVNTPGGWGATWVSSFDAAYVGTAAWMLWPQLSAQTQTAVARVVYAETEWGMGFPVGYYANAAGTVTNPGNSFSDSDSWLPMPAQLAALMMPTNPQVPLWHFAIVRDALASWARPADVSNGTQVNGASLSAWINGGSNVLADGSNINHGRVAYDYSTLIYQNMQEILLAAMAGTSAPQAATTLLNPVYNAYTDVHYTSPPYNAPGGTAYTPGSATIYYPQGDEWGTGQEIPFALIDAESAAFGAGNSTSATYENLHASAELAMQNAHSDKHTYDSDAQYNFVGREEHVGQEAAQLFFTKWVRDHNLASFNNDSYWLPLN